MSKVQLQGNVNGTGTFTVASPNSNSDRTLLLPDVSGTFNTSGAPNIVPAGSASAPAVAPEGDTNTGLYFPAADTVAIATGGVERVRYKSDGFEYNPKKLIAQLDAWPGSNFSPQNFNYQVFSLSTIPNGQYYIAEFYEVVARTSGMSTSNCTGATWRIGYCNDSVSDGAVTNTSTLPSGWVALATIWQGWQTTDPTNGGWAVYNNSGGYGNLLPFCTSFTLPFQFNAANKKLVLQVQLYGSGGTVLAAEGAGTVNIYQVSAVSA